MMQFENDIMNLGQLMRDPDTQVAFNEAALQIIEGQTSKMLNDTPDRMQEYLGRIRQVRELMALQVSYLKGLLKDE